MDAGDSPAFCALTVSSEISRLGMNIKPKLYSGSSAARNLYEYEDFTSYLKRLNNLAVGQRQKKKESQWIWNEEYLCNICSLLF